MLRRSLTRTFGFRLTVSSALVFTVGAVGVYFVERGAGGTISSLPEAFYWLLVTVATVGYGDFTPVTIGGRVIASVLIVGGVALVPIVTAKIATSAVTRRLMEGRGLEKIRARNHTLVCGWNEHLDSILDNLIDGQSPPEIVLVNSKAAEDMNQFLLKYKSEKVRFVYGDFTNEAVLELANARQASAIIVVTDTAQGSISDADQRAVLAALAARTVSPKARICVEVTQPSTAPHARNAGATEVIVRGEHDPFLLTSAATAEGVLLAARRLFSHQGNRLQQNPIPSEFIGKKFADLSDYFREKHNAILIGLVHRAKSLGVEEVLAGDYSAIDDFIDRKFKEAGKEYLISKLETPQANLNPGAEYIIRENEVALVVAN